MEINPPVQLVSIELASSCNQLYEWARLLSILGCFPAWNPIKKRPDSHSQSDAATLNDAKECNAARL